MSKWVKCKSLCLVPVSGVERLHKGTGKGEAGREGQTANSNGNVKMPR